ncbi:hypothetical protein [Sinorhizobium fredii]|uniref:hypothetical protein n=1 Tax=Rhizobium fredii TaxID=380 RepID=UPI003516F1A8
MARYTSPFDGAPWTRQYEDADGNLAFTIEARALTPLRARIADGCAGLCIAYHVVMGVVFGIREANPWWTIVMTGGALAGQGIIRSWIGEMCERRALMTITTDSFAVQRRRFGRWERFDRRHAHRFALVPHDKARREQAEHDYEQRVDQARGRPQFRTPYYQESYIVTFEYLGQRHDLMAVYGRKTALAILARLKACDEVVEAQARKGKGVALTPAQEWGEQPGDIPEHA